MANPQEQERPDLPLASFPPTSNLPEVEAPPDSVVSFVSLLGQPRQDNNHTNPQNESLAFADLDKVEEELCCPICHDIMTEVIVTTCGHSFCYECICEQIKYQPECPLCRSRLARTNMYPNFQLNRLAELRMQVMEKSVPIYKRNPVDALLRRVKNDRLSIATSLATNLSFDDIENIFQSTLETKRKLERSELKLKANLLDTFLVRLKNKNDATIQHLILQNKNVLSDLDLMVYQLPPPPLLAGPSSSSSNLSPLAPRRKRKFSASDVIRREIDQQTEDQSTEVNENSDELTRVSCRSKALKEQPLLDSSLSNRLDERFEDLKELYYNTTNNASNEEDRSSKLETFSTALYDVTRYSAFDVLDKLYYADTPHHTSIVSSVEFDKDDEYFAVGGILKDIKIYDFRVTCRGSARPTLNCPVRRIRCEHKISCLSWSPYLKSQIASSDYQGVINVWDVNTGQRVIAFTDHTKRAWSVDTCTRNPNILASGSDDTTVKVWSLTSQRGVFNFNHKGNICCAKFAPNNMNYLAVGSADHHILCYDLRNPSTPLHTYQGHKKAVSYVKWLNDNELISASTDNSLKLWDRESTECLRTYTGHLNEKNFVGLSVSDDWIACGSETNTVYTYHKNSKIPMATYKFPIDPIPGKMMMDNDPAYFVSSVCWKRNTTRLIAANSKGVVRVLQLK